MAPSIGPVLFSVLALLLSIETCRCNEEHLVCKRIGDAFTRPQCGEVGPGGRPLIRGMPGKLGPRGNSGVKGSQGQKGDQGIVDYDAINRRIDDAVNRVIEGRLAGLTSQVTILRQELEYARSQVKNVSEDLQQYIAVEWLIKIRYSGVGYWVTKFSGTKNYADSVAFCSGSGKPADIIDSTLLGMLVEYIRHNVIVEGEVNYNFWTGMKYDSERGKVVFSNGQPLEPSTFYGWRSGYPTSSQGYERISIEVENDADNEGQGMRNERPTKNHNGIICQTL